MSGEEKMNCIIFFSSAKAKLFIVVLEQNEKLNLILEEQFKQYHYVNST